MCAILPIYCHTLDRCIFFKIPLVCMFVGGRYCFYNLQYDPCLFCYVYYKCSRDTIPQFCRVHVYLSDCLQLIHSTTCPSVLLNQIMLILVCSSSNTKKIHKLMSHSRTSSIIHIKRIHMGDNSLAFLIVRKHATYLYTYVYNICRRNKFA